MTPESLVYAGNPLWCVHALVHHNCCTISSVAAGIALATPTLWPLTACIHPSHRQNALTAHTISPVVGANFAMYMVNMRANASSTAPAPGIERCGGGASVAEVSPHLLSELP